ncbi:MAG: dockerin type I domain-containing protein [Planctomycetota bacterium]
MDRTLHAACVTAMAFSAGASFAQPGIHEGDIVLGVDGDRIGTSDGSIDSISGDFIWDECAFGVELDTNARTPDPGFDTLFNVFPTNASITYAHRAALRKWNGQDFETISPETMRMSFGPVVGVATPPADPAEPILGPWVGVNSNGEYHRHFTFRLELDGSPATGPESLGVYLAELEMRIDDGSLLPTEPFWLVFDNGATSEDFELAIDFARTTVGGCAETPSCPADVNGDGTINDSDFFAWVTAFVTTPATAESLVACDVNLDGSCSDSDFFAWVTAFVNNACQ